MLLDSISSSSLVLNVGWLGSNGSFKAMPGLDICLPIDDLTVTHTISSPCEVALMFLNATIDCYEVEICDNSRLVQS